MPGNSCIETTMPKSRRMTSESVNDRSDDDHDLDTQSEQEQVMLRYKGSHIDALYENRIRPMRKTSVTHILRSLHVIEEHPDKIRSRHNACNMTSIIAYDDALYPVLLHHLEHIMERFFIGDRNDI